jgi:hypothetical protein
MFELATLAGAYPGWSLETLKDLSPRERKNWIEVGKATGKIRK